MSVAQVRGGVPHVFRDTAVTTTGRYHNLPVYCFYLKARCQGNPCKLYFTQADYDNDTDQYVYIPVTNFTTGEIGWEGPVEAGEYWVRGIGGNSEVEIVTFQRRA